MRMDRFCRMCGRSENLHVNMRHPFVPREPAADSKPTRDSIVAEVSVNWSQESVLTEQPTLGQRFEDVIDYNTQRGYRLTSWQLHRMLTSTGDQPVLNETIVAVFDREAMGLYDQVDEREPG